MKRLVTLGILVTAIGCSTDQKENEVNTHSQHIDQQGNQHAGHQHQHRGRAASELIVASDPADPIAGQPVNLRLMIHAADGTMVKNFEVVHEEKVHLVVVRDGLDHFAHIHPSVDANGNLTVAHTFPAGGKYRLFADYASVGGEHATAAGTLSVGGESEPAPKLVENAPGNIEADGILATVSTSPLKTRSPVRVTFALKGHGGQPAGLENYMGQLGHLMFIGADSGDYVHVHPLGGEATQGKVEFEAHFPKPGLYKGWGQFKHSGDVRVVPFVAKVL
jgi:hypothetical protein